ncbi:MAG: hypothetical protein HC799_01580 [Limnothrix sp. RL_2_0]|nr:hypothetical protein [Limnothrix sp. RL_2_0]
MATPCNPELAQAPFHTYRDPLTGEWSVKKNRSFELQLSQNNSNVISFDTKLKEKRAV